MIGTTKLYMIRTASFGAKVVLAVSMMEETPKGYRTPRDANGNKDYTRQSAYWNAETLRQAEEYKLLSSTAGLYMWGRNLSRLLECWEESLTPHYPDTKYDSRLEDLLPEAVGKAGEPVEA